MSPSTVSRLIALLSCAAIFAAPQTATVAVGVPLRITLDHRLKITQPGVLVAGHLSSPVYVGGKLAVPAGSSVTGAVTAVDHAPRRERLAWLMRGDFTPPREPRIQFERLVLPDGNALPIDTAAAQPSGTPVHMEDSPPPQGLKQRLKDLIVERKQEAIRTIKADSNWGHVKDQLLLALPYHSQWIDAGASYDAALDAPLEVPVTASPQQDLSEVGTRIPPNSILRARLLSTV
ncbi:MAG: hypothetical protein ABI383_10790, partial [Acidobacteriaceae bacterium]